MSATLMTNWPQHPLDCPPWDYEQHPLKKQVLPARVERILRELINKDLDSRAVALDTRGVHGRCFRELTPAGYEYFAGHYRGEKFRCLLYYQVSVRGDSRVGYPPQSVQAV